MTAVVLSCTWYCHDDVAYMMFSSFASNTTGFQLINDSQHKNILRKKKTMLKMGPWPQKTD